MANTTIGIGRGRGRGRGAFFAVAAAAKQEPTVGGGDEKKKSEVDEKTIAAEKLAELKKQISSSEEAEVVVLVLAHSKTDELMKQAITLVYDVVKTDWQLADRQASICRKLVANEHAGLKYRNAVIQALQRDFIVRETLRSADLQVYLGCLSFLCQVAATMKDAAGEPFVPLLPPTLDALEGLLDDEATDGELLCAAAQLGCVGRLLLCRQPDRCHKVLDLVRGKILATTPCLEARTRLLQALEHVITGPQPEGASPGKPAS